MKEENKMAVKTKIKDLAIGSEFNAGPANPPQKGRVDYE